MTLEQLGVVLQALLPKDGTARSVAWLCDLAQVTPEQVHGAMTAAANADPRLHFDVGSNSYSLRREQRS